MIIRFLLWLLNLLGWKPVQDVPIWENTELFKHAEFAVKQVEEKFPHTSGEFKRAQALRMLLNITNAAERDCALTLEMAVRKCHPR